jgi:hypothetical protein
MKKRPALLWDLCASVVKGAFERKKSKGLGDVHWYIISFRKEPGAAPGLGFGGSVDCLRSYVAWFDSGSFGE